MPQVRGTSRDRSSSSAKAAAISGLTNLGKAIFEPPGQDGHSCQWIALFDQLKRSKLLPGKLASWQALSTATCTWVAVNGNEHTMLEESLGAGRVDSMRIIDAFGGARRFNWYRDNWDNLDGEHSTLLACIGMLADVYCCNIAVIVYCCSTGTINESVVSNARLSNERDGCLEVGGGGAGSGGGDGVGGSGGGDGVGGSGGSGVRSRKRRIQKREKSMRNLRSHGTMSSDDSEVHSTNTIPPTGQSQ